MRWLQMALVSEGPSDDLFLPPVLHRSAVDRYGRDAVVEDVVPVRAAKGPAAIEGSIRALRAREGSFNLVVVHHDHDGSADRWIGEFRRQWLASGCPDPVAAVVPVRETEAWALADGDVLRRVLGVTWDDRRLGLPDRRELEGLLDPKALLRRLMGRHRRWDVEYLARLGELVSLERLRELSAFRRWEDDLAEALHLLPGFLKE